MLYVKKAVRKTVKKASLHLLCSLLISLSAVGCDTDNTPEVTGGVMGGVMGGVKGGVTGGVMGGDEAGVMGGGGAGVMVGGAGVMLEGGAGVMNAGEVAPPVFTTLTLKAINPLSGGGLSGLNAARLDPSELTELEALGVTDEQGEVSVQVEVGARYHVTLSAPDTTAHHIIGVAADEPSTQITFVSNNGLTAQVFSLLGITPSPDQGIIVVGLDRPDLSPAVGASVEIDQPYESAFALGSRGPVAQQEITEGVGGFITFANVAAGDVNLTLTPPAGEQCRVFSAETEGETTVPSLPGQVTVVAFTCR